ncbi:SE1561 family protein [Planococcus sp. N028]|uniref:SE1561 family protein n=1 Tax=Planococcus shixiaomingii TaxID=3058393 RepID=A0ABT8N719_9BACL|nr:MULTISPECIES: SE1561 family protein [unclassified Planococcus (in: firmicutes)]MDN7243687.1 SE1561 family protein [Planococcus sp. N028]WKA55824.1 SE1561 family protein [Planococcus sp. N022]
MGKGITNKEEQVIYMKERLNMFLEVLDTIEPENTELEDIDRLIAMVDELDEKMQQFRVTPTEEKE